MATTVSSTGAEGALRTDEQAREVVAGGRLARAAPGLQDGAVGEDHGQREDVLAHRAVAHRVRSGGARRGHAAERRVGAGVEREEQPGVPERLVQRLARDAGLDHHVEILGMYREHAVHARQVDGDAAAHGEDLPFDRTPRAERDHRHAMRVAGARDRGDFVGGNREHHGVGRRGGEGRLVAGVVVAYRGGIAVAVTEQRREFGGERRAPARCAGAGGCTIGGSARHRLRLQ